MVVNLCTAGPVLNTINSNLLTNNGYINITGIESPDSNILQLTALKNISNGYFPSWFTITPIFTPSSDLTAGSNSTVCTWS